MRIVLLGATGFVGHHLLARLSAEGHECLALSRDLMSCRELSIIPRVRLSQTDVYDRDKLAQHFQGADAVVNMVGILNESGRRGKGFHKAHVELLEGVLDACRRAGVGRLVQVSALNAGKGKSHYLRSKGEAEERIRAATDLALSEIHLDAYHCRECERWVPLSQWSMTLCLSCSMDRDSDVFG